MKKSLLALGLLVSGPVMAFDFLIIPSLEEQYQNAQIETLTESFEQDDYFAGKLVEMKVFGRQVTVDRRGQAPKPNAPKPNLTGLNDVLNGLDAGVRANVEIDVLRQWHDNGLIKEERWKITLGGGVTIEKVNEEPKRTGEDKG